MGNKSKMCYNCEKKGKVPIYHRDEQGSHKVAFYVCKYCMNFSGFINLEDNRSMPYFNDIVPSIKMRLQKKIRISSMKKTEYSYCNKCKEFDYARLFFRNRVKNSYDFTGYVCMHCKTCFFKNTPSLNFGIAPKSMGSFFIQVPEEEKPIEQEVTIRIKKTDVIKLKKYKIKFKHET